MITVIMVGKSAMAELIICTINTQKTGYIRCHKQNIGILTSDPKSTEKPVLLMYNMSYSGVVSSVPFWIIIIVFALVKIAD